MEGIEMIFGFNTLKNIKFNKKISHAAEFVFAYLCYISSMQYAQNLKVTIKIKWEYVDK